ncbi:MAG TPA: SRPBCC family protein [Bryobacteraceae bacterium]|nr:SRPBCC family protein [Bryobacteraceae bacterium]
MEERSVTHSTFVIERSLPTTPARVFAAFADPSIKRRWYADDRHMGVEEFTMDFRVGGRDHAGFRFKDGSPFPGMALANDTTYQDIVPDRRIVIAYTMTLGDKRFSASLATFEFLPTSSGTDLVFTEQGAFFEGADGPQMREEGWRKLIDKLAEELAR